MSNVPQNALVGGGDGAAVDGWIAGAEVVVSRHSSVLLLVDLDLDLDFRLGLGFRRGCSGAPWSNGGFGSFGLGFRLGFGSFQMALVWNWKLSYDTTNRNNSMLETPGTAPWYEPGTSATLELARTGTPR